MTGLMQQALGDAWHRLPPALQAHYRGGRAVDRGHLDIDFPAALQPVLALASRMGALVQRRGQQVDTTVEKTMAGERQRWQRTLRYADGRTQRFDSVWQLTAEGHVREFVNGWLALQMQPYVVGDQLHYRGICLVATLCGREWRFPEWLALGHTVIVERAVDERHFAMDFRMVHPWFGQLFRYAGTFEADAERCSA